MATLFQFQVCFQNEYVAVEQSRGSLVFMLSKYEHLVVFPVHPTTLADYRKSLRPSGAESDPSDAALLLDVLTLDSDKLLRRDRVRDCSRVPRALA